MAVAEQTPAPAVAEPVTTVELRHARMLIDGAWVDSMSGRLLSVENPAKRCPIAEVPRGDTADVNGAVEAAASAVPAWSKVAPRDRGRVLLRIAEALETRSEELACTAALETGNALRTQARPILRSLVGETNEAASIGVLDGSDVIYVERIQAGLARLGVDVRIGNRLPAYAAAIGHAILAWLPRASQEAILQAQPRVRLTPTTQTDLPALLKRLAQVKRRGYAVSDQETVPGLYVLAAPILDIEGVPVAGISIAAPAIRMTLEDFRSAGAQQIVQAAQSLSKAIQATGGFVEQQSA